MPNFSQSRLEYLHLTKETTFGQAVAPANDNYCRHIKATLENDRALLIRKDKTGNRSVLPGIKGRAIAKWSTNMSLVTSGSTGVPDCDVLLQMLFGNSSGRSYTLSDGIISGNIWRFREPSTLDQQVGIGAILKTATFTLGQDIAEWAADGDAIYALGSNFFSVADITQKGGLGSFPTRPSSPVANGNAIAGFTGQITVDGVTLATIRTATIKVNTGNEIVQDTFGSYYGTSAEGDERKVTFGFNLYDDDSSGAETIKEAADAKAPITAVIQVGTVTNNMYTFTVNGVQLESPTLDDNQRRFVATYKDSQASESAIGALDELSLVIS